MFFGSGYLEYPIDTKKTTTVLAKNYPYTVWVPLSYFLFWRKE
jgi:hypothetical protein